MLPYRKIQAIQDERERQFIIERERAAARRRAAKREPGGLRELLQALAESLAGLGIPSRGGEGHPAGPAY